LIYGLKKKSYTAKRMTFVINNAYNDFDIFILEIFKFL